MRVKVTMACTECKQRNYNTKKNKKNDPDRLEMNKFCKFCRKHTLHRETKEGGGTAMADKKSASKAEAKTATADSKSAKTAKKAQAKKPNRVVKYFKDLKSEFKKVVWPSKKVIINNTSAVLATMVVCGAAIWGLDTAFVYVFKLIGLY